MSAPLLSGDALKDPCESECDCGADGGQPHVMGCHSEIECDEGHYCDKHLAEAEKEHAYLRHVDRREVFNKAHWTQDDWDAEREEARCRNLGIDP